MFKILFLFISTFSLFCPAEKNAANYGEGDYGAGDYGIGQQTPTPTLSPTPTATLTPTSVPSPTSAPVVTNNLPVYFQSNDVPGCNQQASSGVPDLFEIRTTKNSATLHFGPPPMPYTSFYIAYSRKQTNLEYGLEYDQGYSGGVLRVNINQLNPNTKYYFTIRSGNGCASGQWSNQLAATTTKSNSQKKVFYRYNRVITKLNSLLKKIVNKVKK